MSRRTKIRIGAGLLAVAMLGAVLYLRSAHFLRYVQTRIVRQIESATGGRVELGSYRLSLANLPWLPSPPETSLSRTYLPTLEAELQNLVIRGRETDPDHPLFAADSIFIRLKAASLFWRKIDWRLLRVSRPRIHLQVDAAGRSNIPVPERRQASAEPPVDKVLDLAIKRLEVAGGELHWNDQRLPLEFTAENLLADFAYEATGELYDGRITFATALWRSACTSGTGDQRTLAGPPSQVNVKLHLSRAGLQILRLSWETPRSTLLLSGHVLASAHPKIRLNYEAGLDIAEIAAVSRLSELRSGQLQLKGMLSYDTAEHTLDSFGDLRLERLALGSPAFRLSGIYGTGKFHVTRQFIEMPAFRLLLLGGELEGNLRADFLEGRPKLSVVAQAHGLSVSELTRALATPQRPLTELRWAGAVDGDVRAQLFLGGSGVTRDARVESVLSVRPPPATPPGMFPLSGQGKVFYASSAGQLTFRRLSLQTPALRISAEGVLATGRNSEHNLQLGFSTAGVRGWAPLIAAWHPGEPPVPLEQLGHAQIRGTLRGAPNAPRLEGRVQATDFRYAGTHWTGFAANLLYSPELFRLTEAQLHRGGSVLRLNFTAHLKEGKFTDASPLYLKGVVDKANLADLASLTGTAYPVTGQVVASIQADGTRRQPRGRGWVRITRGTLAGEAFDSLRADLNFAQGKLRIADIELTKHSAKITGEAEYRPDDRSYRFQLTGVRLDVGEISRLRCRHISLSGRLGFRASGAGVLNRPSLEAVVEVSDLEVNGERVGNLSASMQTRDSLLEAHLESQLIRGNIAGNMTVGLAGELPAQGQVEFTGVDLDPLFEWALRGHLTAHSTSTGFVTISGPLKQPESLSVAAEIRELRVAIEQAELRNEGPLRASFRDGWIQIEPIRLAGAQTNVLVAGSLRLTGPPAARTLKLRAEGEMNMALLRTLNSELTGSGKVTLDATVTGTLQQPLLTGRAQIYNGGLALRDFPTGFSKMEGSLVFDTHRVQIEKLTAQAGGGKVHLGGFLEYGNRLPVLRLRAKAEGIRLRYPEGTSSLLNASLNLNGTSQHSVVTGEVVVSRASFNPRFDLASTLGFLEAPSPAPVTSPLLHTLHLDVQVISSPDMHLELARARDLQVQANLRLRGTAARPALLGRVDVLQGEILFAGTRYVVNRGAISFVNPFRIEPVLNLHLQTRVQQYEILIAFNGPLNRLSATYRSEPPLPSSDVQALLITGQAREGVRDTQLRQPFPTVGTNAILERALNKAVGSRIERIFGAGRVKIGPHVGGPETSPSARVTLEQQITPDVKFTYITNLASTQQQVIQMEWIINRRWSLNAVRDRNGLFGIDFKWRQRFR